MINTTTICYYDFETNSVNKHTTQPLSLAAVAICPRKLEIIPNSMFSAFIKPLDDDEAIKKGLDPTSKSALAVNKIVLADLKDCANEGTVWRSFADWTYQYNPKKDSWGAMISAGFNIDNFDRFIVDRLCKTYGFWNDKRNEQKVFNPIQSIDLKNITWLINENNPEIERNSFDAIRDWLGLSKDNAHSAEIDVLQGAEVLCRCMRFIRTWSSKTKFVWQ